MEKPTRICHMQDVLGSMLKEPRYKNVICVDPELRHNFMGEQNPPSRFAGQVGCPRSMARKHCCASSGHTVPSLHSPTWALTFRHSSTCCKEPSVNQWQAGVHDTETNTPRSDELWQDCNVLSQRRNQNYDSHISHHRMSGRKLVRASLGRNDGMGRTL